MKELFWLLAYLLVCVVVVLTERRYDHPTSLFTQYWSFKIRRTTFLNCIKFVNPGILRLYNCERARRTQ